jgi:hypothetical protein
MSVSPASRTVSGARDSTVQRHPDRPLAQARPLARSDHRRNPLSGRLARSPNGTTGTWSLVSNSRRFDASVSVRLAGRKLRDAHVSLKCVMPGGHRGYPSCMIKHAIRRPGSLQREVCSRAGVHALGVQVGEREDRAGQVIPRDLALVGAVVKPTGQLSVDQRDNELTEVTGTRALDMRDNSWAVRGGF